MKRIGRTILRIASSYGLALIILLFLFAIVFIGTLEQTQLGLYDVQQRYFTSFFFLANLPGGIKLPLPGVYLLMSLLAVNLIAGNLVRVPWRRSKIGLHIVHWGILFMLLSSLVTHHFAVEGQMTLAPGETKRSFESYHEWEVAIIDRGDPSLDHEFLIPDQNFKHLHGNRRATFQMEALPFDVTLSNYERNAQVLPKGPMFEAPNPVLGGFFVNPLAPERENERNNPAVYLTLTDKSGGTQQAEILWGSTNEPLPYGEVPPPLVIERGGRQWDIALRRQRWPVPFAVTLKKFTHEYHPGTRMARTFRSDIVKSEDGHEEDIVISMNEPLRHEGFTLFQASFQEYPNFVTSTFAVVRNPADQWPLIGCIVVTIGMLLQFGNKLMRHLRAERAASTSSDARAAISTGTATAKGVRA